MTKSIDLIFRAVIAGSLLFLSYVAYGFHKDRIQFAVAVDKGAALQEHCRLMRSLGKQSDDCF